jgi:hypothetical protein
MPPKSLNSEKPRIGIKTELANAPASTPNKLLLKITATVLLQQLWPA